MDVPSWAKVGTKVVCVEHIVVPGNEPTPDPPVKGRIYTIAAVMGFGGRPALQFDEIDPLGIGLTLDGRYWENSSWWGASAFRPLVSTKTQAEDVAMFKKLARDMTPTERLDRLADLLDMP